MEGCTYAVLSVNLKEEGRHYVEVGNSCKRTRVHLLSCNCSLIVTSQTNNQAAVEKRCANLKAHVVILVLPLAHILVCYKERHVSERISKGCVPAGTFNVISCVSKISPEEHSAYVLVDTTTVCVELNGVNLVTNLNRFEVSLGIVISKECACHLNRCIHHTAGSILRISQPDVLQRSSVYSCLSTTVLCRCVCKHKQKWQQYCCFLKYLVHNTHHLLV